MSTTTDETAPTHEPATGAAPAPASDKTNTLAIVALILSFVVALAGLVCGHIALRQIKRTGERGRGMALAATILGYVFTAFWALILAIVVPIVILIGLNAAETAGY